MGHFISKVNNLLPLFKSGVRSQVASRLLGALFREGCPSLVESQVPKLFPICLPHFNVVDISYVLRKHLMIMCQLLFKSSNFTKRHNFCISLSLHSGS